MNPVNLFLAAAVLATFVEGTVEYIFSDSAAAKPYLKYIALAVGVGVSLAYNLDILAALGIVSPIPFVGAVISGLIIGRGSNYLNDFVTSFQKPKVVVTTPPAPTT